MWLGFRGLWQGPWCSHRAGRPKPRRYKCRAKRYCGFDAGPPCSWRSRLSAHALAAPWLQVLYGDGSARVVEEDGRELEMHAAQLSAAVKAPCPEL